MSDSADNSLANDTDPNTLNLSDRGAGPSSSPDTFAPSAPDPNARSPADIESGAGPSGVVAQRVQDIENASKTGEPPLPPVGKRREYITGVLGRYVEAVGADPVLKEGQQSVGTQTDIGQDYFLNADRLRTTLTEMEDKHANTVQELSDVRSKMADVLDDLATSELNAVDFGAKLGEQKAELQTIVQSYSAEVAKLEEHIDLLTETERALSRTVAQSEDASAARDQVIKMLQDQRGAQVQSVNDAKTRLNRFVGGVSSTLGVLGGSARLVGGTLMYIGGGAVEAGSALSQLIARNNFVLRAAVEYESGADTAFNPLASDDTEVTQRPNLDTQVTNQFGATPYSVQRQRSDRALALMPATSTPGVPPVFKPVYSPKSAAEFEGRISSYGLPFSRHRIASITTQLENDGAVSEDAYKLMKQYVEEYVQDRSRTRRVVVSKEVLAAVAWTQQVRKMPGYERYTWDYEAPP